MWKKGNLELLGVSIQNNDVQFLAFASNPKDCWLDVLPRNDQRQISNILDEYKCKNPTKINKKHVTYLMRYNFFQ